MTAQDRYNNRLNNRAKGLKKSKKYFGAVTKLLRAYYDIHTWDVSPGKRRANIKRRDRTPKLECLSDMNVRNGKDA